jgi:hypothetical protein
MDSRAGRRRGSSRNGRTQNQRLDRVRTEGMALCLAGRYDDAMEIEEFRKEFVRRFGEEVLKKKGNPPG